MRYREHESLVLKFSFVQVYKNNTMLTYNLENNKLYLHVRASGNCCMELELNQKLMLNLLKTRKNEFVLTPEQIAARQAALPESSEASTSEQEMEGTMTPESSDESAEN